MTAIHGFDLIGIAAIAWGIRAVVRARYPHRPTRHRAPSAPWSEIPRRTR